MEYSLDKTYTENLQEQPDSKMPFQIEKFGYKQGDPSTLGPALEKQEEVFRSLSKLNSHDWLTLIEISTGVLGMIPTPLSPFLLGISTAAGVADAALYWQEGDKYMATIMFALTVIPGGELFKVLKGSKVLTKRGIKGSQELIKKYKSGAKLTSQELDDIAKLGTDISKNAADVTKLMKKTISENIAKYLADKTPKFLMNILLFLKKIGIIKLSDIVLKTGATVWTFDKLYLFVFRDSILANKKDLDVRTRNELRAFVNDNLGYEKEVNEYIKSKIAWGLEIAETSKKLKPESKLKISETPDNSTIKDAVTNLMREKDEAIKKYEESIKAPSINEILSGKKSITINQRGESVKEIQKMLYSIGYDYLVTNFETLEDWNDGIYGKSTKLAVETFQEDNGLKVDGVMGKNTLTKLNDIYKNMTIDKDKTTDDNEK
jgi:hypothetical protein